MAFRDEVEGRSGGAVQAQTIAFLIEELVNQVWEEARRFPLDLQTGQLHKLISLPSCTETRI
jgi:hypothetical protein